MKIKQFRAILAVATVVTSIAASSLPAQAFTWDDLWNAVKKSGESSNQSNQSPESNGSNNQAQQSGGFNNDTQQQPTAPTNPVPPQNNPYQSTPSQTNSPAQQPNIQRLAINCISANGTDFESIDRDSPESNISVGRRPLRVSRKFNLYAWGNGSLERTCRILRHPSSEKVRVAYAIPDNSSLIRARVSIYVNGQEKTSGILVVGQARAFTADIAGASSYAVVVKPLDGSGYIYPIAVPAPL
jgi:hypothetical protein